jgi:hypothetical protein
VVVEIVTFVVVDNNHLYRHSLNLVTQEEDNNKSYDLYNYNNKTRTTSTDTVLT